MDNSEGVPNVKICFNDAIFGKGALIGRAQVQWWFSEEEVNKKIVGM